MYEKNFWDIFGRRNQIQLTMPQILRFWAQIYSARQRNYLWAMSKVKCPRKTTGIFRNVFNIDLISKSGVGVFTRGSACTTAALNKMDSEINTFYRSVASWIGTLRIFWEGHKILRNLHRNFDWHYIGQIYGGDFAKFYGLLRVYELY